jgi:hypothetical protein
VLNLRKKDISWVPLRRLNAQVFFEFNDNHFSLKMANCGEKPEKVYAWIEDFRRHTAKSDSRLIAKLAPRRQMKSDWKIRKVMSWDIDLGRPARVVKDVHEILSEYGPTGMLEPFI